MIEGWYYDGRTSRRRQTYLDDAVADRVSLSGEVSADYPMGEVQADVSVGSATRRLRFSDGALFETQDWAALDRWLAAHRPAPWWHRAERYTGAALLGLALTALLYWLAATVGIPALAGYVADHAPPEWDVQLGQQVWDGMDKTFFQPSELSPPEQQTATQAFARLQAASPEFHAYRLFLRKSSALGANAIALPGGLLVVTDELVRLARHQDEITAVLAHEFAHVHYRHGLRTALQQTVIGLLVLALSGDVSVVGGSLPLVLMQSRYSQEFETQADVYAAERMRAMGIPVSRLADMLEQLERYACERKPLDCRQPNWLSTHPATDERIARLRALPVPSH
jgi:Zn-dependent protease with chaperone function